MRVAVALLFVLSTIAPAQEQVRDPVLLADLFETVVVGADLPPGHRLGAANQQGWTIGATANGPAGETIGVVITWSDDAHPLSIGGHERFSWMGRAEREADAVGATRMPWAEKAWFVRQRGAFASLPVRTTERDPNSEFAVAALFDPPRRRVASASRPPTFTTRMIFHRTVVDIAHDLDGAGLSDADAEAVARGYAERVSARVRGALEWERWTKMDTYVRDRYLLVDAQGKAPDGFSSLLGDSLPGVPHDGSSVYEQFRSVGTTFTVKLELAPLRGAIESPAAKLARWQGPDANVHEVYSESLGLGQASMSFRQRMPRYERALVFEGRWKLDITHNGPLRDQWNPDAWTEEEAVEELETFTARLWGAFLASEPERREPPPPSEAPPVVDADPEPEPEDDSVDERGLRLLETIAAMDALLGDVEQPLQEALVQLGVLTRHQDTTRRSMSELSRAASTEQDRKLAAKMRERIRKLLADLQEGGGEITRLKSEALQRVADAAASVRALYEGEDWGALEDAARTRVELIDARRMLFGAQLALVVGDTAGARRAADAMRESFRLRAHASQIEGMALLQEGKTLDALAVFRNAERYGSDAAGPLFESLVRETEVRALRGLQELAGATSRILSDEFEAWIAGRAETKAPRDRTTFEWMVERFLKRPWYDTISGVTGVGIAEADERSREAAAVADDMAITHVGLNFVIGLRRDLSLKEIRDLDTDALRAAAVARWGRDLPEDQLARMRTAIRRAFQLPDLNKLTDETAHIERSSFSGPLVDHLGLRDRWGQAAEIAAMGASTINGWTALTTLAPGARLSVAATGRTGAAAGKALEGSLSLGEYFAASQPVQAAVRALDQTKVGKAALRTARRIDDVAQSSTEGALLVAGAQMVIDGGAQVVAKEVGGEGAAMLVDAVAALGLTGSELPARALRKIEADDFAAAVERMATRAAAQRRSAAGIRAALDRVDAVPDAPLDALADTLQEFDDAVAARLQGYAETVAGGDVIAITQARRDLERMAAHRARVAEQTREGAEGLAELAGAAPRADAPSRVLLDDAPPRDTPIGDPLADAGTLSEAGTLRGDRPPRIETEPDTVDLDRSRAIGDPLADATPPREAPIGDPLADAGTLSDVGTLRGDRPPRVETEPGTVGLDRSDAIGDPLADAPAARPGTERLEPAPASGTPRADGTPVLDGNSTARNAGASDGPALIERPAEPEARLALERPDSPTHRADWHFANDDYEAAILEYQRALTELPASSPLRDAIEARIAVARDVVAERARLAPDASPAPHRPPLAVDDAGQRRVRDAVTGPDADELWVPVTPDPTQRTASNPHFVRNAAGDVISVTKNEFGMSGHPQGRAEHLASLVSERLGRPSPRARLSDFDVDVDGRRQRQVMFELMPDGVELEALQPTTAQLLAHRDALAEDLVYSLVIGDGDRHFGNYLVTNGGEVVPFDYGLADLFPQHPYRHPTHIGVVQDAFDTAKSELDALLALRTPDATQLQRIDKLRRDLVVYQRNALYHDLADKAPIPGPGDPRFEAFVRRSAEKHLDWGTRMWDDHPLFAASMTQETFARHVERVREVLGAPGVVDAIVDDALAGHPDIEFTRALLKTRLEILGDVLAERFPAAPAGAPRRTGCLWPSVPHLGLDRGHERLDLRQHLHMTARGALDRRGATRELDRVAVRARGEQRAADLRDQLGLVAA